MTRLDSSVSPPPLELREAVKQYRIPRGQERSQGGRVTALAGVDLTLRSGRITALLGPNGAGKTTAVRLGLGLVRPTAGSARTFGLAPHSLAARRRIGAMLQISGIPATLRVGEHIDLFRSYYPAPLPQRQVIELAGLGGLERRPFDKLSGGQKQRLLFALALCGDPELLFLDEPTVGLDVGARRGLWESIHELRRQGRTVLLTTHYLEEADALSDRIVVLDHGRVVADGTPGEIKARVAGRRLRFRSRLAPGDVTSLPGVVRVRRDGAHLEVFARRAEPVLREVLARDPDLAELEVGGAGLEEAFLALTRPADPAEPSRTATPGGA